MANVNDNGVVWQVCRCDDAQTLQGLKANEIGTDVYVGAGTFTDETTVPLPSGYNRNQCKYTVSLQRAGKFNTEGDIYCEINQSTGQMIGYMQYYNDSGNIVRISTIPSGQYRTTFAYMVVGVKKKLKPCFAKVVYRTSAQRRMFMYNVRLGIGGHCPSCVSN